MAAKYSSENIVVLEGLDAVRTRPGMYIGTTGVKGMHHLLWEIVDNAIDELANGYGNRMVITLHSDGSASVFDNGRGIPVDLHPTLKISGVEVVFTQLHAGGKFDTQNYQFSGGLHGVGASVANALSTWLQVTVYRNNKRYGMRFESNPGPDGKIRSGIPVQPLAEQGSTNQRGTLVRFLPDKRVFKERECVFSFDTVNKRLKELAFLNKGIEIILVDERVKDAAGEFVRREYKYDGGLADFCLYLNESKDSVFNKPIYVETKSKLLQLVFAMQWTDSFNESIFSYVNNIPTSEGGMHETGFKTGLTKVLNDLARRFNLLKEKEANLMGEDFREGITCVMAVKMSNIQFEGQTKTKLGNPEVKPEVEALVVQTLTEYFEDKANLKTLDAIINKAKGAAAVREAAKKAKEITRAKNSLDSANLIGKLSACSGKNTAINELYIVEGDSAGGSAKQARDRSFQAILPLRGKPLNAEKKRIHQVLANEEIRTIISALGAGIGEDFNLDNLKYDKVIILADADQDGAHIRAILLTFFFRYMKDLINDGHVYIGLPPLYKVYKKDAVKYVYSDNELQDGIEVIGKGYNIQRYKGLGEMNPEQLWETTMNPEKRTLMKVTIEDAADAEHIISTLMGDNVEARKTYIFENVDFDKTDKFLEVTEGR